MQKQVPWLITILVVLAASIAVIFTIPTRLGLDLQGGSQLTIQVRPNDRVKVIDARVMEAVQTVVENRVNGLGVSEAIVQTVGSDKILVQLPGVSDPGQAERVLGGTAQLDFRSQKPGTEAQFAIEKQLLRERILARNQLKNSKDTEAINKNKAEIAKSNQGISELFERTPLTGKNLQDAYPIPTNNKDAWNVGLKFDMEGGKLFADLTKNIAGTGRTLGIFLDDNPIGADFAYTVEAQYASTGIAGGNAEIQANFTVAEANDLSVQLRGGALPVPVEIVENRTVGATLGQDSIKSSIYAGVAGLILVLIFMVVYYRLPGLIADVSLLIYALLTWASFCLLGVTLTLPGIAGFILSIGMAVDANVLIFERTREELKAGKTLYRSVESGFYRAFSSILDGNVTTLISCIILFWLGTGLVKGFALTLGLGVIVSMFTAITCSRTFLFLAITLPNLRKPELFCPNLPKISRV